MSTEELVQSTVAKIDALIVERGGRELGEIGLHALHDLLMKLVADARRETSRPPGNARRGG